MQYSIENEILRLTIDTHGAEPVSVLHKPTGAELLWQGDPAVLGPRTDPLSLHRQADRRQDDRQGVEYAGGQHGFCPRCGACHDPPRRQPAGI